MNEEDKDIFLIVTVSWLRSAQLENASAKGRDRPFDSSVKGLVWWVIDKDIH